MSRPSVRPIAIVVLAAAVLWSGTVTADPSGPHHGAQRGGRHAYARHYPPPGHVVRRLPPSYHVTHHHRYRYYYTGGVWYRPYGAYYRVIAPPVGVSVAFLPDLYTTVWFGGVPYYYANSVYYVRRSDGPGYVVTEPPAEARQGGPAAAVNGEDFFMYPREGQDEAVQARDRYECHRWAVTQTGFDPSQPGGAVAAEQNAARREDYRRAISACLDARGYTVR